jgi:putative ABC transport system permease protein
MLFNTALASSWSRRHTLFFIVLTIALSVALLIGVEKIRTEVRDSFNRSVSGTDLIVGARGGELQLILYSIFHIGQASNNISWASFELIKSNKNVAWAEPISLGDSHKGFRVVGTSPGFFRHYQTGQQQPLVFQKGQAFSDLFDAVVGADVARQLGYQVDSRLTLSHGVGSTSFSEHDDRPFSVSGVLQPTGTPVDQSVFISSKAIVAIHDGWQSGSRIPGQQISVDELRKKVQQPKELTAVLLGMKSKLSTFHLQRQINNYKAEPLQAVLPGVALQQLWQLIRVAENALRLVSGCVVLAGLIGMLAVLLTSLGARRKEMAIMRAIGARPWHIISLLVFESTLVSAIGTLLGVLLSVGLLILAKPILETQFGLFIQSVGLSLDDVPLLAGVVLAGAATGLWPGYRAYQMTAADGLTVRC